MMNLTEKPNTSAPRATPEFALGSDLRRIYDRGTVRIAVETNVAGFGYRDPETGKRSGYDIEVARLITRGIFGGTYATVADHLEFVDITCAERLDVCGEDGADMVIDTFVVSEERRKHVDFTDPYFGSHQGLIVRDGEQDQVDLSTARIGAIDGSIGETIARERSIGGDLVIYGNCDEMADAIEKHEIDAGVNAIAIAEAQIRSQSRPLSRMKPSLQYDPWAIGVRRGSTELQSYINEILLESSMDGSLVFAARGTYD